MAQQPNQQPKIQDIDTRPAGAENTIPVAQTEAPVGQVVDGQVSAADLLPGSDSVVVEKLEVQSGDQVLGEEQAVEKTAEPEALAESKGGQVAQTTEAPAATEAQVEPAVAAAVAPVVSQMPVAPSTDKVVLAEEVTEEQRYLDNIRENGTDAQKRILSAIELYCERFRHRSPVKGEDGARWQHEFLLHALKLINADYDTFRAGWNALLVFFKLHHGRSSVSNTSPISEGPSSRFGPHWERGEESWAAYKNIFELLRSTRNPETRREAAKAVVLERVGAGLITEDGLRNLRRFYQ